MSKLDEIRDKNESRIIAPTFKEGWDEAIALNLPIKFAEWKRNFPPEGGAGLERWWYIYLPDDTIEKKEFQTMEQSYQYWIENIFPYYCCDGLKRFGASCSKNNNCTFPECLKK